MLRMYIQKNHCIAQCCNQQIRGRKNDFLTQRRQLDETGVFSLSQHAITYG